VGDEGGRVLDSWALSEATTIDNYRNVCLFFIDMKKTIVNVKFS